MFVERVTLLGKRAVENDQDIESERESIVQNWNGHSRTMKLSKEKRGRGENRAGQRVRIR
jgi:hypothetical protein